MVKIVTAFDSFKGCMSAQDACQVASQAIREILPYAETVEIPLSDGGEGLVECVRNILPVDIMRLYAHGPLMESIDAEYAVSRDGETAYMEMAATSGLTLVSVDRRNPMMTTTYGVGDMIHDAISRGCRKIVMGIGGSATNDGGRGMISCLKDYGLLDADGRMTTKLQGCEFLVACDVYNPLCGRNGASYVFGPQKGATPEMVEELDRRLAEFAGETERRGIASPNLTRSPGTGAAGGLGYGMKAYLKAELLSGIDVILKITDFDNRTEGADYILTGEGKSDHQTLMGKVPYGVLQRAKARNIPVCLLSGCIDDTDGELQRQFQYVASINEGDSRPLDILMQKDVAIANLKKATGVFLQMYF